MEKVIKIITGILVACCLAGCQEGDPGEQTPTLYDIVELETSSDTGSSMVLQHGDTEPVYMTTTTRFDSQLVANGDCFFLGYQVIQEGNPQQVKTITYSQINNSAVQVDQIGKYITWDKDEVYLMAIWRAGDKIIVRCKLPYDDNPRKFFLLANESTLSSPYPDLYLIHELPMYHTATYDRQYYAAFDAADIFSRDTCQGVTVHIANSNLVDQRTFNL